MSNNSSTTPPTEQSSPSSPVISKTNLIAWCFGFGLIDIFIIANNLIAIAVFTRARLLRKRTNYFLFCLAVADIMVGTTSLPMYIHHLVLWSKGQEQVTWKEGYLTMDICFGFASIFALTVISLERLYSVALPNWHRTTPTNVYIVLLVAIWTLAALMGMIRILFSKELISKEDLYYTIIVVLFLCFCVTCLAYVVIWIKVKMRIHEKTKKSLEKDRKLAMTLLLVTTIFMVTWIPFYAMNAAFIFCTNECYKGVSLNIVFFSKLLHFSNSFVNPVIYALKMPDFRRELMVLFGKNPRYKESKATKMTNGGRRQRKGTFRSSESNESAL